MSASTINFAEIAYPAMKQIADYLMPLEMVKLAMNTDKSVFKSLRFLTSRVRNTKYVVNLEKGTIDVEFPEEQNNFKILFSCSGSSNTSSSILTIPTSDPGKAIFNVLKRLLCLFSGAIASVTVDLKMADGDVLKKLEGLECEKLVVKGRIPKKIQKKRVIEVLGSIRVSKEILVESDLEMQFNPAPPTDSLIMSYSNGIRGSDLQVMAGKTKMMQLLESELSALDVNLFVKTWMNSSETITTYLKIARADEEDWNVHQVLRDIPTSRYGVEKRDRQFVTARTTTGTPKTVENMGFGLDILRKDGLLATVSISGPVLIFCVWHVREEIQNLVNEFTEKSIEVEERRLQMIGDGEDLQQRILMKMERIQEIQKRIEEMKTEKKRNVGLANFLKSLGEDVKEMEAENSKIREELKENEKEVKRVEEEKIRVVTMFGNYLMFL